jgi:putative DNA primase/helicase
MAAQVKPAGLYNLTDVGNAERFTVACGDDVLWVKAFNAWHVYDGRRFRLDDTHEVEARMQGLLKALKLEAANADDAELVRHTLRSEAAGRVRAALEMAKAQPGIAVRPEELDADEARFNVLNGTYYLDADALEPHSRAHRMTKLAPVTYVEGAVSSRWEAFVQQVLPDDELRGYLQRLVGRSLSGVGGAQVMPIAYGSGANGKTVFFEVIKKLFGDYAQTAPAETFLAKKHDGIPNDIARLRGARLVVASEPEEGRRLAVALVKRLTGGDTITARFMHGEFFEFRPTFMPFLVTNHKPVVTDASYAIWRRLRLIPFEVTIPEGERDPHLTEKLCQPQELSGIFNWVLGGLRDYVDHGLNEPEAVMVATRRYRRESDDVGEFLADCTETGGLTSKAEVHAAYSEWARMNGYEPLGQRPFGSRMVDHGVLDHRTKAMRFWNVSLRTEDEKEAGEP